MPIYTITPNDLLFFRDARPMDTAGGSGHGSNWPIPSVFFDAIHAACYRAFPEKQSWEHKHREGKNGQFCDARRNQRFGSLKTAGVFPVKGGQWCFPTPLDLVDTEGNKLSPLIGNAGTSNLPAPLRYSVASPVAPAKDGRPGEWMAKRDFDAHLASTAAPRTIPSRDLLDTEWYTGIGIDSGTQAQDGKSIYSAEYMRLRNDISLGCIGAMPQKEDQYSEGLDRLLEDGSIIVMGGQQRTCGIRKISGATLDAVLPMGPSIRGTRVKWTLLSPAIFPRIEENPGKRVPSHSGGWLPTWISQKDGSVMLRSGPGRNKAARCKGAEGRPIHAHLCAAVVGKALAVSGWSTEVTRNEDGTQVALASGGCNPTLLAVPAGAVYYFEASDEENAGLLADALNWHGAQRQAVTEIVNRRSSLQGEKGFGLGVCSMW